MSKHPKADLYREELEKGLTYRQIAIKYGVSYQAVHSALAQFSPQLFKKLTEKQVVYPNLRRWMNENKVGKREFIRRMELSVGGKTAQNLNDWLTGRTYPNKKNIDLILKITGLTYEQLFYREDKA